MKKFNTHKMTLDVDKTGGIELDHMPEFFLTETGRMVQERHAHTFYEIIWIWKGHGTHTIDFMQYPVQDNCVFFITPGQLHCFDENTSYEGLIIRFEPEFMNDENSTEDLFLKYSIFNAYDSCPRVLLQDEMILRQVRSCVLALEQEFPRLNSFGHHNTMQCLVRILLTVLQRYVKDEVYHPNMITNNVQGHFLNFRRLLETNYKRIHNVKDYADMMGVGTKYLTTIVGLCSSRTPLQIINDRIILEAKRQLRYSNRMIKEIALDLGFDDPSYFIKLFKRHTGVLPTDFRDQL